MQIRQKEQSTELKNKELKFIQKQFDDLNSRLNDQREQNNTLDEQNSEKYAQIGKIERQLTHTQTKYQVQLKYANLMAAAAAPAGPSEDGHLAAARGREVAGEAADDHEARDQRPGDPDARDPEAGDGGPLGDRRPQEGQGSAGPRDLPRREQQQEAERGDPDQAEADQGEGQRDPGS